MTSQPGQQTIAMHKFINISRSKENQTMKHGQLIEYNKRNTFLEKLCGKWGRETSPRSFFNLKKCLMWGKRKWFAAQFQYVSIALNMAYNKNKLYKTLDYGFRDMLNFIFSEKGLVLISASHDFFKKLFLMLHSITDQISLSDCLYFSKYWAICVLWLFVNQAVTS